MKDLLTFYVGERHGAVGEYRALESGLRPAEILVLRIWALKSLCCLVLQPDFFQRLLCNLCGSSKES